MIQPRSLSVLSFLACLALAAPAAQAQVRWHVDASAAPGGDGLGWSSAFTSVDEGLTSALFGDSIWVRAGTYTPRLRSSPNDPRSATFAVQQGVSLFGGFAGHETQLEQRAGLFDQTILSGELGTPGDPGDNVHHVITAINGPGIPDGPTEIDGFTITGGNAVGAPTPFGGGVLMFNAGLRLFNCTIRGNRAENGAGLHAQPSSARLSWCIFEDNHALNRGGGLWGHAINYKVTHTIFRNNSASRGGAVYLNSISSGGSSLPVVYFTNSLFHDNHATQGGAMYVAGGSVASGKVTVVNSTLAFNSATLEGGGIWANTSAAIPARSRLQNTIVWFNSAPSDPNLFGRHTLAYCNVESWPSSYPGNISIDPWFLDGANRDLRLVPGSPSNDAGLNELVPHDFLDVNGNGIYQEPMPVDLARWRRFTDDPLAPGSGPIVDMGAYEF